MSTVTATTLQDKLNSIERNAYDGIDFSQDVTDAYVLADELGECIDHLKDENFRLRQELAIRKQSEQEKCIEYLSQENVDWEDKYRALTSDNNKLRKLCKRMFKDFVSCDCELRARAGRTFMAFTRYVLELRELGIEVGK